MYEVFPLQGTSNGGSGTVTCEREFTEAQVTTLLQDAANASSKATCNRNKTRSNRHQA